MLDAAEPHTFSGDHCLLKICFASSAAFAALLFGASPAQALVVRAWVSGHGSDVSGCGAPTNACRTLQYTHDSVVAAGGEIDILDPAGYGTLNITKAISIVNDGVGTAGVQSNSGNAITINAGATDSIYLRGLNIDGVQNTGTYGIEFKSGGSLTVVNCVVRHFNVTGLMIDPAAGAVTIGVYDSLFLENGLGGIIYQPSGDAAATAVLNRVTASKNGVGGIGVLTDNSSGSARFTISNSDASANGRYGIEAEAMSNTIVEVNTSTVENNVSFGLQVVGGVVVHLARSVFDFNGQYGIVNATTFGTVFSSGDSHSEGNGTANILGTMPTADSLL
jgi:Right handed beta helix region